jgi:hypothetical protein
LLGVPLTAPQKPTFAEPWRNERKGPFAVTHRHRGERPKRAANSRWTACVGHLPLHPPSIAMRAHCFDGRAVLPQQHFPGLRRSVRVGTRRLEWRWG